MRRAIAQGDPGSRRSTMKRTEHDLQRDHELRRRDGDHSRPGVRLHRRYHPRPDRVEHEHPLVRAGPEERSELAQREAERAAASVTSSDHTSIAAALGGSSANDPAVPRHRSARRSTRSPARRTAPRGFRRPSSASRAGSTGATLCWAHSARSSSYCSRPRPRTRFGGAGVSAWGLRSSSLALRDQVRKRRRRSSRRRLLAASNLPSMSRRGR